MTDRGGRIGLILGGGGSVGVAWELGALAGMKSRTGWNPATATVITGTSAGSMAGTLLAQGRDIEAIVARRTAGVTIPATATETKPTGGATVESELMDLFRAKDLSHEERARKVGAFAMNAKPSLDVAGYRAFIASSVGSGSWPDSDLRFTTMDCRTGETVILSRNSGLDLASSVAASCAVPGMFPPIPHGDRLYTDGPRAPHVPALVAELDLDGIIFVGPKLGIVAAADDQPDLTELAARGVPVARVVTGPTFAAVGSNLMDPGIAPLATLIGLKDGEGAAESVASVLRQAGVAI